MTVLYVDSPHSDAERRRQLYSGAVYVSSARPETLELCALAQDMLTRAFGGRDPRSAQFDMPVEQYAAILAEWKPRFIHEPRAKEIIRRMLLAFGCDAQRTYFDVPRLRTSTSDGYLTSGIAYAFHAHRDTWYSAHPAQVNWWLPVYPIEPNNCLAFHPRYWSQGVANTSREYNYQEWTRTSRQQAAQHIKNDTRPQPKATQPLDLQPDLRIVCPPGGVIIFSAAQLHSSVPNTSGQTRVSIDFRTVCLDDVLAGSGAPNVDSECSGTVLGDFLRVEDFERLRGEVVARDDVRRTVDSAASQALSGA